MAGNDVNFEDLYKKVCENNDAEAFNTIKDAAEKGNADALYSLGNCYYVGNGIEKDRTEAVKCYLGAAELGNGPAQFALAVCYYMGDGVKRSFPDYEKWMREAEKKGLVCQGERPRYYI
ncbi:tetratricopeptide repeat protein [Succiniclasticum ruminis]|jgi:TPR repeat protein|uniref:Sel1 repeat-containing protein n=1 Tax=Succiniclasticum ruminis DSM 9236 TaxID=1123323 RepID=A0A1I1YI94_9FIRM|nr:tetratricopeptide repeat protein [Succiniclasticum ruminis]SFE17710.1 hypothetical protein SAMN05216245_102159 [Succiniclasticum ruminis DSM 9236]